MLDASDISRLAEAKSELQLVINDEDLRRRRIPILILANKIDAQVCDNYCDDHQDYGDDRIIMNFDRVIDTLDNHYRKVIGFFFQVLHLKIAGSKLSNFHVYILLKIQQFEFFERSI